VLTSAVLTCVRVASGLQHRPACLLLGLLRCSALGRKCACAAGVLAELPVRGLQGLGPRVGLATSSWAARPAASCSPPHVLLSNHELSKTGGSASDRV